MYVRQSTRQQVVDHGESTRLQYALVDRAVMLGWAASRVMVIDEDLGKSGASAVDRAGFQRLVAEISLGHVGLVLGIDMSRLARSGKDWYQLIELCALSGALLADTDGVYDPAHYNDRLLLGLKGSISEAELHLIKQRMQAGRVNKARRGEMAIALPIGYCRRPSGEAVLDPDEQVRSVVRLVFAKFTELGSIQGVVRYLVENGIEMGVRARSGPLKGEVQWKRPARATVTCMLNSPIYAGIYVYGRRRFSAADQVPGRPGTGRRVRDEDEWIARIEGVLPAYITVEQYRANLARLAVNAPHADTPGAVRFGPALLAGLLRCGRCRRRMTVSYHVDAGKCRTSYNCTGARAEWGGPNCQQVIGRCLDALVTGQVLAALTPASLAVSVRAAEQIVSDRAALARIWDQRLERARIEADRARRCYRLAEPENRLVVRHLEKDWEEAMRAQQHLMEEHDRFLNSTPPHLSTADKAALAAVAADLPALWAAPSTTDAQRKEVIRAVVEEITVAVRGNSELVDVAVRWAGGLTMQVVARRPIQYCEHLSYYPQLAARVLELADQQLHPVAIAARVTAEGFRPARDDGPIRYRLVSQILRRNNHPIAFARAPLPVDPAEAPAEHEWWLPALAAELAVTTGTIRNWRKQGLLHGRQETRPPHRWIIHADPAELTTLRVRLDRVRGRTTRVHPRFSDDPAVRLPPVQSA
ncbi:recombinase family protein [Streptomyces violascens]|uniref:recombinase family protein n=1 Tax=Streptomyces violascens TaxID=67381 RepID=UPI00378B017B